MEKRIFYWHVHHDILVEALSEPVENRIEYIKSNKPKHEIETRLRLMKPANGIDLTYAEYRKIVDLAFTEFKKIVDLAWEEYEKKIEKLHHEQCGCSEWNGKEFVFK